MCVEERSMKRDYMRDDVEKRRRGDMRYGSGGEETEGGI